MKKLLLLITFASFHSLANAEIPRDLLEKLNAAQRKLDLKNTSLVEALDPYKEFSELVDQSYTTLEHEKEKILSSPVKTKLEIDRLSEWIKAVALATYLDPSNSVAELVSDIKKSYPVIYQNAIDTLSGKTKKRFQEAVEVIERVKKDGNGG
jgi:hypothetical protein